MTDGTFHDPFAGAGSLPLEAQGLGVEAHASDLNPVAVLINKAMIEIPPKFAGRPAVNPESRGEPTAVAKTWRSAQGLADDVRRYGQWMRDEAEKRIGHLYPRVEVTSALVRPSYIAADGGPGPAREKSRAMRIVPPQSWSVLGGRVCVVPAWGHHPERQRRHISHGNGLANGQPRAAPTALTSSLLFRAANRAEGTGTRVDPGDAQQTHQGTIKRVRTWDQMCYIDTIST